MTTEKTALLMIIHHIKKLETKVKAADELIECLYHLDFQEFKELKKAIKKYQAIT